MADNRSAEQAAGETAIQNRQLTELMNKRREVLRANLKVCENGHVVAAEKPVLAWEILHDRCGRWTFEDGIYCAACGGKL